MKYVYFLDVQGPEDNRSNSKVFKLIDDFDIPEEQVFVDEDPENRTELYKLVELLEEGDLLIIRSAMDIADDIDILYRELFPDLQNRGIELFSCEEPYFCGDAYFDTLNSFMFFLDFFYKKKRQVGYEKAVDEGRVGRPAKTEDIEKAIEMYESKLYTISQITQLTGVSKSTIYRYLKE